MRSARRWQVYAVGAAVGAAAVAAAVMGAPSATPNAAAQTVGQRWEFGYTGAPQQFTVPAGVEYLTMIAVGAGGGDGHPHGSGFLPGSAGSGGMALASWPVTPGEVLTIWVGGLSSGHWGFGCGGEHGKGQTSGFDGGDGGGASAVTRGTTPVGAGDCTTARPSADAVFVVAGGGGGGGASFDPKQSGPGGNGGNGGHPPSAGGSTPTAEGGCGGCEASHNGERGHDTGAGAGGGAGGGGWNGGGGGTAPGQAGGGGGGGSSFVPPGAEHAYLADGSAGNGTVTLVAGETETFECSPGNRVQGPVPSDVGLLHVHAEGGHGGTRGTDDGAAGGPAGVAGGYLPVNPSQTYTATVGCDGRLRGGWGWSVGGAWGRSHSGGSAESGGGGGGSSGVDIDGAPVVVAGGGGGGGGYGQADDDDGEGGAGGLHPQPGQRGKGDLGPSSDGGCGGCKHDTQQANGHDADRGNSGGGGGGGGAGWTFGGGGAGGRTFGGNGGGGGGGSSVVANATIDPTFSTSTLTGNGAIELTFFTGAPAAVHVYGLGSQQTPIGTQFAAPLEARVTDVSGHPVSGVAVTFALVEASGGAWGAFPGDEIERVVTTGADGVARSGPVTANLQEGAWNATASVAFVSQPARYSLVNEPVATTTSVSISPQSPVTSTEVVDFTATVTPASDVAGTPTGTVTLTIQGTPFDVPLTDGEAVVHFDPGELTLGSSTVEAVYHGDTKFQPSSNSHPLEVVATPTATQVTSSANPSDVGEAVTFTATVTVPPGNDLPVGHTVTFLDDGTSFGTGTVDASGAATSPATTFDTVGTNTIRADLDGAGTYTSSSGFLMQTVDPDGTATHVTSSANPVEYGADLQLHAEVSGRPPPPDPPSGTVAFSSGGVLCTGTLAGGETSCEPVTALLPGAHTIEASYPGDTNFKASTGSMVQQVTRAHSTTSVIASPAGPSVYGEPVTFRAEVQRQNAGTGVPSGGTVQFTLDGDPLGAPVPLGADGATSPPTLVPGGAHTIVATYSGDDRFHPSTGTTTHVVVPDPTTISLAASAEPSQPGQPFTLTATVAAGATAGAAGTVTTLQDVVPEGTVQFRVDGADHGPLVTLSGGQATSSPVEGLTPGRHDVSAHYTAGNDNFTPVYATVVHEVDQPTVTLVTSSENPAPAGASVTLGARVGPNAPAGTLSFTINGLAIPGCQNEPVNESQASCMLHDLVPGTYQIGAAYSGAPLYDPSQGTVVQTVDAPPAPPAPPPTPPGGGPGASRGGGGGVLAFTGSGIALAFLGALLLIVGMTLVALRRSGRRSTSHPQPFRSPS